MSYDIAERPDEGEVITLADEETGELDVPANPIIPIIHGDGIGTDVGPAAQKVLDAAAEAGPVGAYFDVGNVLRVGYPEQWIDILGDRIAAVHAKDYDAGIDNADGFTYPLQGDVPWDAVVTALDDIGYDGWIAPEVSPYEHRGERMPAQVLENLHAVFA